MKKTSVKTRITLLLTLLTAVLYALLLVFLLILSNSASYSNAVESLQQTVQSNVDQVEIQGGRVQVGDGFVYTHAGVNTLIYSKDGALLAGQLPVGFTATETFQNGLTRTVDANGQDYLVLDLWIANGWEDGVWLRGLMEAPVMWETARSLLYPALLALPLFILLAGLGGWLIVKRAFRPLEHISATAAKINAAQDLSGRIGLAPGRDEFSQLAAVFDQMFARLERAFEAERQFTADASHELRTPVSVIQSACEYAQKFDETPEERQETLEMIHRQARRMAQMIEQLLRMTRLEQGTESVKLERTDLSQLVQDACQDGPWPLEQLKLHLVPGLFVKADRGLLTRLLYNLVDNAFKYGPEKGPVTIETCRQGQVAQLSVKDRGPGILPEQQEKIWQRFYQTDPARSGEKGMGLGLAMVQQIARLHEGQMLLQSNPGQGSCFTLQLALA